jgi:hypothetical protein
MVVGLVTDLLATVPLSMNPAQSSRHAARLSEYCSPRRAGVEMDRAGQIVFVRIHKLFGGRSARSLRPKEEIRSFTSKKGNKPNFWGIGTQIAPLCCRSGRNGPTADSLKRVSLCRTYPATVPAAAVFTSRTTRRTAPRGSAESAAGAG